MPSMPYQPSCIIRSLAPALAIFAITAGNTTPAGASELVEITIEARKGFRFQPQQLEVPAGKEVALTLENTTGITGHNLHIPAFDVKTETITPGESDTVRFTPEEPGTYQIRCEVPGHAQAGMVGELKVH